MKNLNEQINKMRQWTNLLENAQLTELESPQETPAQLSGEEQAVVADLTQFNMNEADGGEGWMAKLKQYANKGLLTASVVAALVAAPNLSQAQKSAVKSLADTTQAQKMVRQLSADEMQQWNQFIEWMKANGHQGREELNHDQTLGLKLLAQWKKETGATIDASVVPSIQAEMQKVQKLNADFVTRRGDSARASNIMSHVSKTDNWIGTKTSYFTFPQVMITKTNEPYQLDKDHGLLKGDKTTTNSDPATDQMLKQATSATSSGTGANTGAKFTKDGHHQIVPRDAEIKKYDDGYFYEDPQTGDLIKIEKRYIRQ